MARIRTIKPELPADEKLATISRDARLTFLLIISQADDEGLLLAAARQLLGILYPLDDSVTSELLGAWVTEIVGIGLLRWRATRDGAAVLELVNWSKHQRIDKPTPSKIRPMLAPLAKDSRKPREEVASVQRIEGEVGSGSGIKSGVVDLSEGKSDEEVSTPRPVENPTSTAPLVASATRNDNGKGTDRTASLPFHATKLLRSCYGTAPQKRQDDVRSQLVATLGKGAIFERGQRVQAVDVDHLDAVCSQVLAKPIEKADAAIRLVLIKLRESCGLTRSARDKAAHRAEPPRRRVEGSAPTPIATAVSAVQAAVA